MGHTTKIKSTAIKAKHMRYAFSVLLTFLLLSLGAVEIQATEACTTNKLGDKICGKAATEQAAKPKATTKSNTDGTGGSVANEGGVILNDDTLTQTSQNQSDQLKAILAAFPDVIKNVLVEPTASFFAKNPDPKKKEELLKKLTTLQRKVAELSNSRCGLTQNATTGDIQQYIHNAAANSIQHSNITALSPAQMEQYLKNLEQEVCGNLKTTVPTVPIGPGSPGFVETNPDIENHDLSQNEDMARQDYTPEGARESASNPGVYQSEWTYPNVEGAGGEKIANCGKKMVGYKTSTIPGTNNGRLGCAIAVSEILKCAGYGVGKHLSTVSLYDALAKDKCYAKVDDGHVDDFKDKMKPGDILVTKRGSRAGHTGVYLGDGLIVHNNSSDGTVRNNSNVTKWKEVTSRNPGASAVFRRTCQ